MKITFPCTRCGRSLKARENAVGRTRKCPVCATRVTCPEPVSAAQLVDADVVSTAPAADGPRVNPYANLEDSGAYDVVGAGTGADSPVEARRPCPMCGETILASAVKCRFCGEVLDPALKKGKRSRRRFSRRGSDSHPAAARDVGLGILLAVLGIGLTAFSYASATANSKGQAGFWVYYGLIGGGIVGIIRGIYGMVRWG